MMLTNVYWYFLMVLSNKSIQCLEAKAVLHLNGKYQDSGPDDISLERSEWMCGITALGRFDTTVVCNPFEVRSFSSSGRNTILSYRPWKWWSFLPLFSEILECYSEWWGKNWRVELNFNKVRKEDVLLLYRKWMDQNDQSTVMWSCWFHLIYCCTYISYISSLYNIHCNAFCGNTRKLTLLSRT